MIQTLEQEVVHTELATEATNSNPVVTPEVILAFFRENVHAGEVTTLLMAWFTHVNKRLQVKKYNPSLQETRPDSSDPQEVQAFTLLTTFIDEIAAQNPDVDRFLIHNQLWFALRSTLTRGFRG